MDETLYIAGFVMIGIFLFFSLRTLYNGNRNRR